MFGQQNDCAVDVAVHEPDREGDERNWHAHLLATTRKISAIEDARLASVWAQALLASQMKGHGAKFGRKKEEAIAALLSRGI